MPGIISRAEPPVTIKALSKKAKTDEWMDDGGDTNLVLSALLGVALTDLPFVFMSVRARVSV